MLSSGNVPTRVRNSDTRHLFSLFFKLELYASDLINRPAGSVAPPVEMKGVPRRNSRIYYSKMAGSGVQNLASSSGIATAESRRFSASHRYDMAEFAQKYFTKFEQSAPSSKGNAPDSSNQATQLR